jgi:hypothetical protein
VGNRVSEILKLTKAEDWNHVPGKINSAEIPSRGCTAAQFIGSRWWEGPNGSKKWPKTIGDVDEEEVDAGRKKTTPVLTAQTKLLWFVSPLSSYSKKHLSNGVDPAFHPKREEDSR